MYLFVNGSQYLISRVIQQGLIDVDNISSGNTTPLFLALSCDNLHAAESLFKNGAEVDGLPLDDGTKRYTALQHAVSSEKFSAVTHLLNYGADPERVSTDDFPLDGRGFVVTRSPRRDAMMRLLAGVAEHGREFLVRPEVCRVYSSTPNSKYNGGGGWTFGDLGVRQYWGRDGIFD